MKQYVKRILKNTPVYSIYNQKKLIKNYAEKNKINYDEAKSSISMVRPGLRTILQNVRISNCGVGDFYYCLDTSVVINYRNPVVDNMPVDYEYLLTHSLKCEQDSNHFSGGKCKYTDEIKAIEDFIKRIDDPRITLQTPTTLKQALQSILFWNSLLWQTGHTLVGLGRLDKVLDRYPVPGDAEQLICDFLLTLHVAYSFKSATLTGDTGQIILLGGLEEDGSYFSNQYTSLFLSGLKKVHLPDPKILLRCSANMPEDIMKLAVSCVATGIGSPLFSNDDVIIPKLMDFGYESKDAYNYGVSACWEPLSIGNSLEQNNLANVEYGRCAHQTVLDDDFVHCASLDQVIEIFCNYLRHNCDQIKAMLNGIIWQEDPLLSMMMGLDKDISKGGCKYNNYGILSVGMSAAVNTILNIKKCVFVEKTHSLAQLQELVRQDDVSMFGSTTHGYGTDSEDAVAVTNLLIHKTEECFVDYRNKFGGKVKFGLSSPSYIDLGQEVGATLDGRKAGEPFDTHISRNQGEPLTEIMNFASKLQFCGVSSNANVIDVMIEHSLLQDNIDKFSQYVLGGIREGIFQMQMNVLSYAQLVDAKLHPDKYPDLIVRVWGFSAYFRDLPEEYKDHLIRRAKQMEQIS